MTHITYCPILVYGLSMLQQQRRWFLSASSTKSDTRLSTAVRADRMRGGRNKFGPLYRQDRQMKQQKVHNQANSAPYRIKMETTQMHRPTASNEFHHVSSHTMAPLPPDSFHQSHMYPPGAPMPLDCTVSSDRVLTPPSLPYPGLYHRAFPGYLQENAELPFSYTPASASYPPQATAHSSFTPQSTPASSPRSTPSSSTPFSHVPLQNPETLSSSAAASGNFLEQLLEGEQDESQLCTKVVTSLQREQANRGKHDRLNTFSIMCKMADQTLFGLVEWARNSSLFKELKVENNEHQNKIIFQKFRGRGLRFLANTCLLLNT